MLPDPISPVHSSAADSVDTPPAGSAQPQPGAPSRLSPDRKLSGVLAGLPAAIKRSANAAYAAGAAGIAHGSMVARKTTTPIGKSRFPSVQAFSEAAFTKYQSLVDEGYARAERALQRGRLQIPHGVSTNTVLGQLTDDYARTGMKDWLADEGIGEGLGKLIQVNRQMHDPSGSSAYRIPDIRIPGAKQIYDATLARKSWTWPQIRGFHRFSSGSVVTIVRPSQLGGSYSIIPR
ncbi:hypothetical protein [Paraburkholderia phosphatilytica]|uniref:hypothetical protein n=1 Tax=Paraburkholderia phosphatilytica TaxID=2282883 RepID=UPI000E50EC6C|nr:hypothetical protein [Paraburkholderia phosphatilytica]